MTQPLGMCDVAGFGFTVDVSWHSPYLARATWWMDDGPDDGPDDAPQTHVDYEVTYIGPDIHGSTYDIEVAEVVGPAPSTEIGHHLVDAVAASIGRHEEAERRNHAGWWPLGKPFYPH